ncbi:MAG: ribosome biogenesis GTPase YlqF [Ruminococcaceae bacterium]|nr:ribosome biogenesis GTPase YlqF [Oscillospiraceae bacterium]
MPTDIIQWFPGHMAKTKRLISESLSSVDVVLELLDARIPKSSKNPDLEKLVSPKPIITLLNKASLADPNASALYKKRYAEMGKTLIITDCIDGKGIGELEEEVKKVLKDKIDRYNQKGMTGRTVKAMVLGIPNVGKSSLINKLSGKKAANVENRPGVTLTKQWVKTSIGLDLLDMPGVLWPKFDDRVIGENLAITGAIKDTVLQKDEIAMVLCERLKKKYPYLLAKRYSLEKEEFEDLDGYDIFELIGKKRGILSKGGEVNFDRCSTMLLDEFRRGIIGRITLE